MIPSININDMKSLTDLANAIPLTPNYISIINILHHKKCNITLGVIAYNYKSNIFTACNTAFNIS